MCENRPATHRFDHATKAGGVGAPRAHASVFGPSAPHALGALAADAAGQLNVLGHDGNALGVDGAQVGVIEDADDIRLGCLRGVREASAAGR